MEYIFLSQRTVRRFTTVKQSNSPGELKSVLRKMLYFGSKEYVKELRVKCGSFPSNGFHNGINDPKGQDNKI